MTDGESGSFLDTSCIVRYLTGEPPEMADRAAKILDSDKSLLLSELVLVETAYVLESFYEIPRDPLVDALAALVQRRNVRLLHLDKTLALQALVKCRGSKRTSFTDALLWAQARQASAPRIFSFDRRFPSEGLEVVGMDEVTP
jgi:predicted nucleic acid-binding protein